MRSSKKIAAWMLAAAMATGLLAGCGGSSGNETTALHLQRKEQQQRQRRRIRREIIPIRSLHTV